jgi:uncharacterized membrane protein
MRFQKIKQIFKKILSKTSNNKYLKFISNFFPKNIFMFLILVISSIILIKYYNNYDNQIIVYSQNVTDSNVGAILTKPVNFNLNKTTGNIMPNSICIKFGTYQRENDAKYKYNLYKKAKNKKIIADEVIFNSKNLKDGENYCFAINIDNNENITDYSVSITPIYATSQNSITIFSNSETNELAYTLVSTHNARNYIMFFMPFIVIAYLSINYLINTRKIKIERFWLILVIAYFIPIMLAYPPYEVPDEPVHFYNAYRISQLNLSEPLYKSVNNPYIYMPSNISCLTYSKIQIIDKVQDLNDISNCNIETENEPDNLYGNYNYVNGKLGYIASSIGIKYTDNFTNSPLKIFYSGRLANLLLAVLLIYLAFKITPKYKELFLIVGTIPMFIQQMVSYSYDSLLNAACLLAMAIILNLIYNKNNNLRKYGIVLIILGTIIANIKSIYLTILLFILFIPKEKFNNNKWLKYAYCLGIIIISFVLGMFLQSITQVAGSSSSIMDSENLHLILEKPLRIFKIAFNTFKINGLFYLQSLIGYFTWFKYKLNDIFILIYILIFTYIVLSSEKINNDRKSKIICAIGILISFAATFAAMYFTWSKTDLNYVDGVQGRYFIPILLPFIVLLFPKKAKFKMETNYIYYFVNIMLSHYLIFALLSFF